MEYDLVEGPSYRIAEEEVVKALQLSKTGNFGIRQRVHQESCLR